MAAIRPFQARRYNPQLVGDLSRVIAPPYDVIDVEEQEQLYRASPYNIVRLILGKPYPNDTKEENRYTRAERDFAAWRDSRILQPDSRPAVYLLQHAFRDTDGLTRIRLGFIALLQFSEAIEQTAYRHEATLAAPKEDRTRLLQAIPANLEPIFCIYPDDGGKLQTILRTLITQAAPAASARLHDQTIRLWTVPATDVIQTIASHLAGVNVLIADGHHRFEVAYANRKRYNAVMSYFVSMAEPSLVVRPIHRLVLKTDQAARSKLEELCVIEPVDDSAAVLRWLHEEGGEGRFGFRDHQRLYRVSVRPEPLARWLMAPTVPLPLATLDVSILHGLILPHLGLSEASNGTMVRYTADAAEAMETVSVGEAQSAWLLRGIPLTQVYALASAQLSLPPKSTFFYPKVPSGLTVNPFA